jgi:arsenite methyltransferase
MGPWRKWQGALIKNAQAEGVSNIQIVDGDVRFNVVVSNFVINNINSAEGRAQAVHEMSRVLKPNGRLVISDIRKMSEYTQILTGLTNHIETKSFYRTFPFSKVVVAHKKAEAENHS